MSEPGPNSNAAPKKGRGGARAGAGRKTAALPPDLEKKIGEPPLDPLGQSRWYARTIVVLTWAVMTGAGGRVRKMLEMVRQSSAASAKILPHDIIFEANRRLDRDDADMKDDGGGGAVVERQGDHVAKRARAIRRDPT